MKASSLTIILLVSFVLYTQVNCTTWYVKNFLGYVPGCGSKSNPCGIGLLSTYSYNVLPGDTVHLTDSTFINSALAISGLTGSAAYPITVKSVYALKSLTLNNCVYTTASNLNINRTGVGLTVLNSQNIKVSGATITGPVPSGPNVGNIHTGLWITSSNTVTVGSSSFTNGAPCIKIESSTGVNVQNTNSFTGCNPNVQ